MPNAVRPLHLVRASAPLWSQGPAVRFCAAARPPNTRCFSQSSPTGSSSASSLDEWTRAIQAQTAIMHDTADLNKARQLLLVLPNLPAAPSPVTSSRELVPKYTGEGVLSIECGSPMPLGSELVLFNPLLSESTLAKDGTERTFGPPGGLDQRMWASGSFNFEKGSQLKVAQDVQCQVKVESVVPKQGAKTGMMVLVTRSLVYTTSEGVAMTERRTHVYRKPRPADQRKYVPLAAGKAPKPSEGKLSLTHPSKGQATFAKDTGLDLGNSGRDAFRLWLQLLCHTCLLVPLFCGHLQRSPHPRGP